MKERYVFRGKHLSSGEWVAGHLVYGDNQPTIVSINSFFVAETPETFLYGTTEDYFIDPATLGQCTGLRDKNGRLMFKGDIISILKDRYNFVIECGECEVKNGDGCIITNYIGFYKPSLNGEEYNRKHEEISEFSIHDSRAEIIGNIIDNPELLEVTK